MVRRTLGAAAWLAAAIAVGGCKLKRSGSDIPRYPGAQMKPGRNFETDGYALYNMRLVTPDSKTLVRQFYDRELLSREGWTATDNGPQADSLTWTDGQMVPADFGEYRPREPSVAGGLVNVMIGEGQTVIDVWQAVPRPEN